MLSGGNGFITANFRLYTAAYNKSKALGIKRFI
jgi:hypothetical protein